MAPSMNGSNRLNPKATAFQPKQSVLLPQAHSLAACTVGAHTASDTISARTLFRRIGPLPSRFHHSASTLLADGATYIYERIVDNYCKEAVNHRVPPSVITKGLGGFIANELAALLPRTLMDGTPCHHGLRTNCSESVMTRVHSVDWLAQLYHYRASLNAMSMTGPGYGTAPGTAELEDDCSSEASEETVRSPENSQEPTATPPSEPARACSAEATLAELEADAEHLVDWLVDSDSEAECSGEPTATIETDALLPSCNRAEPDASWICSTQMPFSLASNKVRLDGSAWTCHPQVARLRPWARNWIDASFPMPLDMSDT